jgi:hypothetical protein
VAYASCSTVTPGSPGAPEQLPSDLRRHIKGIRELKHFGIVDVSSRPQGDIWDYRRMRNAYWVNIGALQGESSDRPCPRVRRRNPCRMGYKAGDRLCPYVLVPALSGRRWRCPHVSPLERSVSLSAGNANRSNGRTSRMKVHYASTHLRGRGAVRRSDCHCDRLT